MLRQLILATYILHTVALHDDHDVRIHLPKLDIQRQKCLIKCQRQHKTSLRCYSFLDRDSCYAAYANMYANINTL